MNWIELLLLFIILSHISSFLITGNQNWQAPIHPPTQEQRCWYKDSWAVEGYSGNQDILFYKTRILATSKELTTLYSEPLKLVYNFTTYLL
jgi:hypothetical protein